jgi:RNA polymerase sigma factor (sigma-70 family)
MVAKVYKKYFSLVYSLVYGKTCDVHDADDITQEIFVAFLKKYEEIENPYAWLLGTIKNYMKAFYRNKKAAHDNFYADGAIQSIDLSYINGFRDARILLDDVLNNEDWCGNEQEKIIFDLIALQKYKKEEVATMLCLTRRQVQYRYDTTIKKILHILQKKGIKNIGDLL